MPKSQATSARPVSERITCAWGAPYPGGLGPVGDPAQRTSLLDAFDSQLRGPSAHLTSPGARVEVDGQVVRALMAEGGGMVAASGLTSLGSSQTHSLVRSQVELFSKLGQPFEWKTWSHDHPESFYRTLLAFGFTKGAEETVMVGAAERVKSHQVVLPPGATVRQLRPGPDFRMLEKQLGLAFGEDRRGHALGCEAAVQALPDHVSVHGVESAGQLVASGRLELVEGTDFGTLWAGSVVPLWRHRGLYRALLVERARRAEERGFPLLQVDALATSRPILERLGLVAICTTTGYLWDPVTAPPQAKR